MHAEPTYPRADHAGATAGELSELTGDEVIAELQSVVPGAWQPSDHSYHRGCWTHPCGLEVTLVEGGQTWPPPWFAHSRGEHRAPSGVGTCPSAALRDYREQVKAALRVRCRELDAFDGVDSKLTYAAIGHRVCTQDNRSTSDVYYTVQQLCRVYGPDDGQREWHEAGDEEFSGVDEATAEAIEEHLEDMLGYEFPAPYTEVEFDGRSYKYVTYVERWDDVDAFLTLEAAETYIARNRHNYPQGLRTYAKSACRNPELKRVRRLFEVLGEGDPEELEVGNV